MRLETFGVRVLFIALLAAFLGEVVFFPVWSEGSGGVSMRILLTYVGSDPAAFILDRLVSAAVVVGLVGVALVESSRRDLPAGQHTRLSRERVALLFAVAIEAAVLVLFGWLMDVGPGALSLLSVLGILVSLGVGLYLFWTARRLGSTSRAPGVAAIVCAGVSGGLSVWTGLALGSLTPDAWGSIASVDTARWLHGEAAIGLWIIAFSGVLLRSRKAGTPVSAAS